jgi:LemA protein
MRSELREVIRRIHSADYQRIVSTEKQIRQIRRRRLLNRLPGWKTLTKTRALRLSMLALTVCSVALSAWGGIHYYNAFAQSMSELDRTSSLIQSEAMRRADLIPNLTVVSAEYSAHEVTLYKYVSEMRTFLGGPSAKAAAATSPALEKIMTSLLAVSEQYPNLQASRSFEELMKDWNETENRIALARAEYILAVKNHNALWTRFPSNVYGFFFGMKRCPPYSYKDASKPALDIKEFYSTYLADRVRNMSLESSAAENLLQSAAKPVLTPAAHPGGGGHE